MVIRALPKILKKVPDIVYVVAGTGEDVGYVREIARQQGVSDRVKVVGEIEHDSLPLLYNCCDVFILCSRKESNLRGILAEGFGIVFLEASSTGKPVIGGKSGGISEAVKENITGLLVDPMDPDAIADAVIRLITDGEFAQRLGQNGRRWVEEEMNWERATTEFCEAYWRFFPAKRI